MNKRKHLGLKIVYYPRREKIICSLDCLGKEAVPVEYISIYSMKD